MYDNLVHRVRAWEVDRFLAFRAEGLRDSETEFKKTPEDDIIFGVENWCRRLENDYVLAVASRERWLGVGGFSRFVGTKLQHKGLIWGMYVVPAARGSGVSDLIMESLLEFARPRVRQVQLTVVADNRRARAFYARHGFESYATEPDAIRQASGFADETSMWRRFEPSLRDKVQ